MAKRSRSSKPVKRSPYSVGDQVRALSQSLTQKEIAARLGVSERTVRRWKNNEKWAPTAAAPVQPKADNARKLVKDSNRERKRISQHNRRVAKDEQDTPRDLPVIPVGHRRRLKAYDKDGQPTGEERDSNWINYDVSHFTRDDLCAFVESYAGRNYAIQFVYKTKEYKRADEDTQSAKWVRAATALEFLGDIEPEQVHGLLNELLFSKNRRPLFAGLQQLSKLAPKKRVRRRRKK